MRFIKIIDNEWFAVIEPNTLHPEFQEQCRQKMVAEAIGGIHAPTAGKSLSQIEIEYGMDMMYRLKMRAIKELDFCKIATEENRTVIVREKCSYMFLGNNDIIEKEIISDSFPVELPEGTDIVICENDERPNYYWLEYLKKRFPDKKVFTINHFRHRDTENIKDIFQKVKYVTFYTTFTNCDWWETVKDSVNEDNEVIGYCVNNFGWENALEIFDKVEIVKELSCQ